MHRASLLSLLDRYRVRYPTEPTTDRFRSFVETHPDCLERSCIPGHITGSAWILSPDAERALLTHHRKLGKWLQLGGHVDGSSDVPAAALREAREESGIDHFSLVDDFPLDLDVHEIPARGSEPTHLHYDVRFLLRAGSEDIRISDESIDLRWFTPLEIEALSNEESLLRMLRKAGG